MTPDSRPDAPGPLAEASPPSGLASPPSERAGAEASDPSVEASNPPVEGQGLGSEGDGLSEQAGGEEPGPSAGLQASDEDPFRNTLDLGPLARAVEALRAEIGAVIVGQEGLVDELIAGLLAGGHVLIEGVPGVAKTLTARLLAAASGLDYRRIQFTPDLMPADVLGSSVFSPASGEFTFHPGPIFGQVVLIDEINRAPAKTQAALFETMEEHQATVDGTTYPMPAPFLVLATQNPVEHEGTYRLPEAQLDRFLFKVVVGYPSLEDEVEMLGRAQEAGGLSADAARAVLSAEGVLEAQALVRRVRARPPVLRYAAEIVGATRQHPALYLGASPRATLALVQSARAVAAMSGRDFVTPEDVRTVVAPVLRHRVALTPEREIEGVQVEAVLRHLVEGVEVPR